MAKIYFRINKEGEVDLEVAEVTGAGCEEFTKKFEEKLGVVTSRQYQDTYYVGTKDTEVVNENSQLAGDENGNF